MINSLNLKNFKPFQSQFLTFKPLTLLSGLNSTGKSSVFQSLLLLRQSYQQNLLLNRGLALNGDLVCIGTAQDALFEGARNDLLCFELELNNGNKGAWSFNYDQERDVLNLSSPPVLPEIYQSNLFNKSFHYLQAERMGPRPFSEMSDYQVRQLRQLGKQGEYTAHFLSINLEQKIFDTKLSHPEVKESKELDDETAKKSLNLLDQVEAWMGEISPGTRIQICPNPNLDLMSFQYRYGDGNPYRPTNVGFGITYTLPILVAILSATPDTLILLENPEAHLHPKGQAKIGELLALAASCGVQIVVETHSDHILNGIRVAVHDGKLNPQDVQLHYFQRREKEGLGITEVISPKIDRNGRIDRWPEGFFDEWDKSLEILLEPVEE